MKIYRAGQKTFASFCRQGQFKQWIFSKDASDTEIKYPESEACICTPCWFSFDAYGWVLQQVSCLIFPSDLVNKFPGPLHSCVPLSTRTFRILWTPLHQSFPWLLRYQKFESNFSLVFLKLNTTWESSILGCCRLSPLLCSPSMSVRVCTRMEAIVRTNCCFCIICSGFHCVDHPSFQTYFKLMISDCWLSYVQRTLLLCFWSSMRHQSFNSCFLAVQSHGRVLSTGSFKVCILYLCFALWFSFSFLLWFCCTNKKIGRKRLLLFCFYFQLAQLVCFLFAQTNSSFCGFVAQTQRERERERIKHAIAAIPICPWSSNFHVFRMIKWLMLLILHQRYVCTKVFNLTIQTMQALLFLIENASIMEIK